MTSEPALGRTAVRPSWSDLPPGLRQALTERLGTVQGVKVQGGGFSPGLAVCMTTSRGRFFVKAIGSSHVLAIKYRAEARASAALPAKAPAPRLLWHGDVGGWVVLAFEDVVGRHPDLSPGSPDVATAVAGVAALAQVLTPNPLPDVPPASPSRGGLLHGWAALENGQLDVLGTWERTNLDRLVALERTWIPYADGDSLIHGDIRPDNLLIREDDGTLIVVDWAQPCQGAPWQDVVDLIPHLIMAGHSPADAEKTLAGIPAWEQLPPAVITGYAAAYAGYWTRMSMQPPPPGVPNLRAYQARAGRAALTWIRHRARELWNQPCGSRTQAVLGGARPVQAYDNRADPDTTTPRRSDGAP